MAASGCLGQLISRETVVKDGYHTKKQIGHSSRSGACSSLPGYRGAIFFLFMSFFTVFSSHSHLGYNPVDFVNELSAFPLRVSLFPILRVLECVPFGMQTQSAFHAAAWPQSLTPSACNFSRFLSAFLEKLCHPIHIPTRYRLESWPWFKPAGSQPRLHLQKQSKKSETSKFGI
jgi:hypothetical protein